MITNKYSSDHNILVAYHKGQTVVVKDSATAIGKLVLHFKAVPYIIVLWIHLKAVFNAFIS